VPVLTTGQLHPAHASQAKLAKPEHAGALIRTADHTDDETVLIVGIFTYAGTGWKTTGDALLANTAADQARKRRQAGHDQLADEYVETMASTGA
jgi:hypothetical protein